MSFLSLSNVASAVGVTASLIWIGQFARIFANRRKAVRLRDLSDDEPKAGWPSLAVIVAARDEDANVERSVRSLLAQDYPALEIIAVDDRSSDRTGTILDTLAREAGRLQVVHVTDLPSGWLGKTNAMQRGAEATNARWLLFTDADILFTPGVLRRALALAEREGLDHLTVSPDAITHSVGERLFMVLFSLLFSFKSPQARVEDRESRASIGIGAFNLVRAEVFETIGGFKRVALSVDEDMRLGQAIKYAGYRNRHLFGTGDVAVRWQVGLGGMIRGVEKNFFAALDFRLPIAIVATLFILVATLGPTLGLFVGPWWARALCAIGIVATMALLGIVDASGRRYWFYVLTLPISGPIMAYALIRSTLLTWKRQGVSWRGTLYPLSELKAHVGLRNYWLHEVWHSTR